VRVTNKMSEMAPFTARNAITPSFRNVSSWFRSYGFADVFDGLLIGCYPLDEEDVAMLHWAGVERVLNLVEDDEYRPEEREAVERAFAEAGIQEQRLPFPDFGGLPLEPLDRAVSILSGWLGEDRRIYVHCRAGWQRAPAIAAALVALRDEVDIDEALDIVRVRKPSADPLPHQREDLWRWWQERGGAGAPSAADVSGD
jgi:atypical dual specificity phosphatase